MTTAEAVALLTQAGVAGAVGDVHRLREVAKDDAEFRDFILRRAERQPVSQILGLRPFWKDTFIVTADVLDPRPDTETLVEAALDVPWQNVLDLGTGSACILLSLLRERDGSTGVGTDISEAALHVADRNRALLGLKEYASFLRSDWFSAVEGQFDLIVSNPPYISEAAYKTLQPEVKDHEPKLALTPGGDGLAAYRIICAEAAAHLTPGGHLMVEIGYDQAAAVSGLFEAAGFHDIEVLADLNGKDRVIRAVSR